MLERHVYLDFEIGAGQLGNVPYEGRCPLPLPPAGVVPPHELRPCVVGAVPVGPHQRRLPQLILAPLRPGPDRGRGRWPAVAPQSADSGPHPAVRRWERMLTQGGRLTLSPGLALQVWGKTKEIFIGSWTQIGRRARNSQIYGKVVTFFAQKCVLYKNTVQLLF